mmetsp:Transcript_6537/g.20599  ORF Transcript_6537/g.20599 Transcript_6537/m.20599 type:complete len:489 (+) Transcript_6537:510-1976(+)
MRMEPRQARQDAVEIVAGEQVALREAVVGRKVAQPQKRARFEGLRRGLERRRQRRRQEHARRVDERARRGRVEERRLDAKRPDVASELLRLRGRLLHGGRQLLHQHPFEEHGRRRAADALEAQAAARGERAAKRLGLGRVERLDALPDDRADRGEVEERAREVPRDVRGVRRAPDAALLQQREGGRVGPQRGAGPRVRGGAARRRRDDAAVITSIVSGVRAQRRAKVVRHPAAGTDDRGRRRARVPRAGLGVEHRDVRVAVCDRQKLVARGAADRDLNGARSHQSSDGGALSRVVAVADYDFDRSVRGARRYPQLGPADDAGFLRRGPAHDGRALGWERQADGTGDRDAVHGHAHEALDVVQAALDKFASSIKRINEDADIVEGRGPEAAFERPVERLAGLDVVVGRGLVLLAHDAQARPAARQAADDRGLCSEISFRQRALRIVGNLERRVALRAVRSRRDDSRAAPRARVRASRQQGVERDRLRRP